MICLLFKKINKNNYYLTNINPAIDKNKKHELIMTFINYRMTSSCMNYLCKIKYYII